jgi:phosphatidylinositol-4,5-bisphosphate 3-kinase catalytic subunit alpha/beta/delta
MPTKNESVSQRIVLRIKNITKILKIYLFITSQPSHSYKVEGNIQYPSEDSVINYAKTLDPNELNRETAHSDERKIADILQPYCTTMYYDRLNDMPEQERNAIWAKREECLHSEPNGLPSLLYCVEWNNRNEVAEMCRLLKEWPVLPVERSLELLDYAYADRSVRSFAVSCLRRIRDEELLLYLLQLVQAIKHESYLHCDLVEFLLERAFNNQRIGHFLFWHLRSEIQVPSVQQRFGLILEAYLMGSQEHILLLLKQAQCLEKLKTGSEMAKRGSKEKCRSSLQEYLRSRNVSDTLSDFINPLNPSFRCKMVK